MLSAVLGFLVIAYLPGALFFRMPVGGRARRSALACDERAFWAVVFSVLFSTTVALLLAGVGKFTAGRLEVADLFAAAVIIGWYRRRLLFDASAPGPGRHVLLPLGLIVLGLCMFYPSSEYLIGGKDPGTYINEGISIARNRSLFIRDQVIADLPAATRDLFVGNPRGLYTTGLQQGPRFMGFFVLDRDRGQTIGQFPHAFPVWIAIGFSLLGLPGALGTVGAWALFGLLAVYFAWSRLIGRVPAALGCVLLTLNVAEVWFARYPNSEMMQQALLFAGILAAAHAFRDDDPFFIPVAAVLLGSMVFVRFDAVVLLSVACGALLLLAADGRTLGASFLLPLLGLLVAAAVYYETLMKAYVADAVASISGTGVVEGGERRVVIATVGFMSAAALTRFLLGRWPRLFVPLKPWIPRALVAGVAALAVYAYFFRHPAGPLASYDAYAFRTFAWYVGPIGLAAAVAGLCLVTRQSFWRDPVLVTTATLVSVVFFYKVRIVPEHFWQARRWIPVVFPTACMAVSGGALAAARAWTTRFAPPDGGRHWSAHRIVPLGAATLFVILIGAQFVQTMAPVFDHVEYGGMSAELEKYAARVDDRDLVVVESRNSSDAHVLATPLAYIYGKNVLLLYTPRPDPELFRQFIVWAQSRYQRVLFMADGGSDLALPFLAARPVAYQRFQVPEYESAWDAWPRGIRQKKFALTTYALTYTETPPQVTDIAVGGPDNLWVYRIHAREESQGVAYRWTRDISYASLQGIPATARIVTLWMDDGGRPAAAGEARVSVLINDRAIGDISVRGAFKAYQLAIPPEVAAEAAQRPISSIIKLVSTTWRPSDMSDRADTRQLGVMLSRIRVE